jgi:hypothetical protein
MRQHRRPKADRLSVESRDGEQERSMPTRPSSRLISGLIAAIILTGCEEVTPTADTADTPVSAAPPLDDTSLQKAARLNASLGGCEVLEEAPTRIDLASATLVKTPCTRAQTGYTDRYFRIGEDGEPVLLFLPDFDGRWFATDRFSMAEVDAGTGVLTTFRKPETGPLCGSEGRYEWIEDRFALQQMGWRDCDTPEGGSTPFPVIWPTQIGSAVRPDEGVPAP